MTPAIKNKNRLHVKINQNFVVKVMEPNDKDWKLTTARKLNNFVNNPTLTEKLFKDVLTRGEYVTTFKIRKRLKIKFHSK